MCIRVGRSAPLFFAAQRMPAVHISEIATVSFEGRTARFVSNLVVNHNGRFSRDEAHILTIIPGVKMSEGRFYKWQIFH